MLWWFRCLFFSGVAQPLRDARCAVLSDHSRCVVAHLACSKWKLIIALAMEVIQLICFDFAGNDQFNPLVKYYPSEYTHGAHGLFRFSPTRLALGFLQFRTDIGCGLTGTRFSRDLAAVSAVVETGSP